MKTKSTKHLEELEEDVFNDIENLEDENDENQEEKETREDYKSVTSDDSVKVYLQQIGKIPLLSYEEEMKVAKEIKENNSQKAKETLMDDCGYSEENANSFLEILYYAVASEYGD